MGYTDYGIDNLGSFIQGLSPSNPAYMAFGAGSGGFVGSQSHLGSEFLRKAITWTWFEGYPQANVSLSTVDANGSSVQELGLVVSNSALGSDAVSRDLSAVGPKNSSFDVDISYSVRISRP